MWTIRWNSSVSLTYRSERRKNVMAKLKELARYVRSKNAGPFWVTIDIFFADKENYERVKNSNIDENKVAELYGTKPELVKKFFCDNIDVIKFSWPRPKPSGNAEENDMHFGQQYVFLSETEVVERDTKERKVQNE